MSPECLEFRERPEADPSELGTGPHEEELQLSALREGYKRRDGLVATLPGAAGRKRSGSVLK